MLLLVFTDPSKHLFIIKSLTIVYRVERLTEDSVVFQDGTRHKIDAVVLGTGYETHFDFLECPDIKGMALNIS